ncbi:putative disease resistance protein [Cardamine amara subsp. amara]|uniref:Disease resistance protein n=1 Tax=Cardamine amara subsp. amara TaxID=228776 RepID=A0ABD1AE07_CARAN
MADIICGEVITELVKQLYAISSRAYRCRGIALKLGTRIEGLQPTIKEIQYSGVELTEHRQVQLRMFSETLDKCKKLTDKVIKCNRWNMVRQLYHVRKMEDFDKKISTFLGGPLLTQILADVHLLRADSEVRLDRIDRSVDSLNEKLGSMKLRGSESLREALKMAEATVEMETDGDLENLGVGLELGKKKVKEMLFNLKDEGRLIGISGMSGSGKTTLAKELAKDEEVRGHFGNRVLFLTVSQSPNLEELRSLIWGFLTANEVGFGTTLPESIGQTQKLVILDDVWTMEFLDQLMFKNIPGTTTLVVSRSKLADPITTYDVELLNEHEATALFCLSAFDQKSVPSGFCKSLVKQVVVECKGLPLALKVIGASLKNRPEKYWEGAVERLSRGEPADETHESRVFAQIEATLETLDPKTRECFLGLGAFPEDKKIPLDVLINMFVELHDLVDATAFAVLVDLANRNLLTLVKDPRFGAMYTSYYDIFVTQHDVLRDVALRLSSRGDVNRRERLLMPKRESVLPREWERSNDKPYNARIVSIHTDEMTEMEWVDMELPKAEVLILNFTGENYVLPPFIAKMGRLRALVIINNDHCDDLVELPSTICGITSLNSISVTNCPRIKELPKNLKICELPRLKYVDISQCVSLSSLPEEIGKVRTLEKIDMRECGLANIPRSTVSLTSLRHVICDRDTLWMWEEVEKAVQGLRVEAAEKCFSVDWLDD